MAPAPRIAFALALVALVGTQAAASPTEDEAPAAPAFELRRDVDLPLIAIGAILAGSWYLQGQLEPAWCAPSCDPDTLNPFDRLTAGAWSPAWSTASGVGAVAGFLLPAAGLLLAERPRAAVNDFIVVAESALLASGFATAIQMAVRRPRPYLYGDEAPADRRADGHGGLAFYSGHTTTGFAVTVAGFQALSRLHARGRYAFLAGGAAIASFVGLARVLSGNHFPTDVLAGAATGAAFGVLVPALHRRGVTIAPSATADQATLQLAGSF